MLSLEVVTSNLGIYSSDFCHSPVLCSGLGVSLKDWREKKTDELWIF
jgi:hypothetical protein